LLPFLVFSGNEKYWDKRRIAPLSLQFFLVFATSGITFITLGTFTKHNWLFYAGLGITIYGATYFLIHDVYIHQRFEWFRQLDSKYSRGHPAGARSAPSQSGQAQLQVVRAAGGEPEIFQEKERVGEEGGGR
jgi:cytochrome c biogenesis protein CcdA